MSDPRERESLPHDHELGELYRRLPQEEPRAEIDRAILEAGRRAAARPRNVLRQLRWAAPLAAAAGVVLTLTLTQVAERSPERVAVDSATTARRDDEAFSTKAAKRTRPDARTESPQAAPSPTAQDSFEKDPSAAGARQRAAEREELHEQPAAPPGADLQAHAVESRTKAPPKIEEKKPSATQPAAAPASPALSAPAASPMTSPPSDAGSVAAMAEPQAAAPSSGAESASAPCMDDGVESTPDPPALEICPFQFRANFSADATCEAMSKHLRRPCRVDGDHIEMWLKPPVAIADGALVERIVVELEAGQALRMRMQLAGGGERVCPSPKPAR